MMCKIWLRGLDTPSPPAREVMAAINFFIGLAMKIERFAGHKRGEGSLTDVSRGGDGNHAD